jgi:hypothetical protein
LGGDAVDDVGVGQPGQRVELDVPAGVGDRLERHRPHRRVGEAELDDVAELVLVEAALHGGDQGGGQARVGAVVQRLAFAGAQVAAADLAVGALVEPVELQVDVDRPAGPVPPPDLGHEVFVGGEADAVGVEVDRLDRTRLGGVDEVDDVFVDGGFAAGEHHHLGLTFGGDEHVQHRLALSQGDRIPVGLVAGVGEAHRAVQVAAGVHLDDPQAGVLLVLRAQAAVGWAAVADLGLEGQRYRARLVEPGRLQVHLGVAVDEGLEPAMFLAALAQVHLAAAEVDLGVHDDLAHRADRLGVLHEHLVTVPLAPYRLHHRHLAPLSRSSTPTPGQPDRCAAARTVNRA